MSEANGNGYHGGNGAVAIPSLGDRLPPANIEAEQGVLGSLILEPQFMGEVRDVLCVADFFRATHEVIYQALLDIHDRDGAIDYITLCDELRNQGQFDKIGGHETLKEIVDSVPQHGANCVYYAGIVREKAENRRQFDFHAEGIKRSYSGQYTSAELFDLNIRGLAGVVIDEDEEDIALPGPWPDPLGEAAYQGPIGEIVRAIEPHSTADSAATLLQFLVAWGNLIGRGPHWYFESTRHSLNLFLCIVGRSSRARKGTSWGNVRRVLREIDRDWEQRQVKSGFASGEALIDSVRDARTVLKKGQSGNYVEEEAEPAAQDKRMLWIQAEFGSTLTLKGREGNILSYTMRDAWDGISLEARSRKNPVRATDAHISAIGHITMRELRDRLSAVDMANGFANRYLWACVRQSKVLPMGGDFRIEMIHGPLEDLKTALTAVRRVDWSAPMSMSRDAVTLWFEAYPSLSRERPGILDDLCARAEPQVWRLAAIYATADSCPTQIQRRHLEAALAVWPFCEASVGCLFGGKKSDHVAGKILACLRANPNGLTRTEINRKVFHGRKPADELDVILADLAGNGQVSFDKVKRGRNKCVVWKAK